VRVLFHFRTVVKTDMLKLMSSASGEKEKENDYTEGAMASIKETAPDFDRSEKDEFRATLAPDYKE
jgi:hypothetical protein